MSCCYVSYLCLLLDIASNYFTVAFFHCQSCAFRTSKPHYCQHTGFRGFLWVGSSCWEEVTLFHCKSCAFIRSKPRQCQTHWFQRFFCALGHHVGKRWLSFIARAVLSLGRSHAIAKHTGFRGFLWVGSSCWEEVALFHCKSCAFSRSKPHYCQTHWFQRFFLWVGSSCWEEVTLFHCKSCAFIRSKPRYCQTHWVGSSCWEEVTDSLSFPHGILMVYHLISILSP